MRLISLESPHAPALGRTPLFSPSPETKSLPPLVEAEPVTPAHAVAGVPVSVQMRCRIVRQLTAEMLALVSERVPQRRDRRRAACHVRQIAMYICHVVLQVSLTDIGTAFGRDRTTVGHACNVVEDRRDDKAYDEFVAAIERVVISVFGAVGGVEHA